MPGRISRGSLAAPVSAALTAALLALSLLLASGCGGGGGGSGGGRIELPRSALLERIADGVDAGRMMDTIEFLSSPGMKGRPAGSPQNAEAAAWLEGEFRDLGLEPFSALGLTELRQDFQVPSSRCFLEDPPADEKALTVSSVIGTVRGAARPDRFVVVAANFDGLGVDAETGDYYPGADFNASGAAAVLELARVTASAGESPPVTLVFALLNAEECGHYGSRALADACEMKGLKEAVRIIDLEGLAAGGGDYMDVWDQNYAKNRPIVGAVDDASAFLGVTLEINGTGSAAASSLFFIYHMACVTCDWSWFERSDHPDYHKPTDTPDRLNEAGLRASARVAGVAAWLLAIRDAG